MVLIWFLHVVYMYTPVYVLGRIFGILISVGHGVMVIVRPFVHAFHAGGPNHSEGYVILCME